MKKLNEKSLRDTKRRKQEKGITLIALVVTIIVLLILAGISISMLTGQNGILNRAGEAKEVTEVAQTEEQIKLAIIEAQMQGLGNLSTENLEKGLNNYVGEGNYELTGSLEEGCMLTVGDKTFIIDVNGEVQEVNWIQQEVNWIQQEDGSIQSTDGTVTLQIGDYVNYDATNGATETSYTSYVTSNGYGDQTFTTASYTDKWRVLGVENGQIVLIPETIVKTSSSGYYYLQGQAGYINAIDELNKISALYGQGKYATGARSITVEDVNKITGYDPANPADGKVAKYGAGDLNEYGNKVTYSWQGTDYPYYSGTNGKTGSLSSSHSSGFTYWNGKEFVTSSKSTTASTSAMEEITTLTSDVYYYYPNTYTTSSSSSSEDTVGIETISKEYSVLFENTSSNYYWLGSRCVNAYASVARFGVRRVNDGFVNGSYVYSSGGDTYDYRRGVRPLVYLQSDVHLTLVEESEDYSTWKIVEE